MKQKDYLLIVTVVVISIIVSVVVSNKLITPPKNRQRSVETVAPISSDFPALDTHYFNNQSIDPTQTIQIGTSQNQNAFGGTSQ